LAAVEQLVAEKACTASQIALAWCLTQPGVTAVLLGSRTLAQLADNLSCLRVQFTADGLKHLDAVAPPYRMTVPFGREKPSVYSVAKDPPHLVNQPNVKKIKPRDRRLLPINQSP
jgi:diketogulonate reductase-like aldo/keto reductase